MALQTTRDAVRSILKTDPTCSADDRQRVLDALSGKAVAASGAAVPPAAQPRIVPYAEAAKQLGCGVKLLHRLVQTGAIRKCRLPGRVRCRGVLEEDLTRLLADGVRVVGRSVNSEQ